MKRAALVLAVMLGGAGCGGGSDCPTANDLTVYGDAPPYADAVLRVAQEHCDRPMVGTFRWVDSSPGSSIHGHCSWAGAGCPMDAWSERTSLPDGTEAPAWMTSEAHELGHWCLRISSDGLTGPEAQEAEGRVNAWASAVNDEVCYAAKNETLK